MALRREKYHEGQALFTAVIFFLFISLAIVMGLTASAVKSSKISLDLLSAKKSYFVAESGTEDAVYRVIKGKKYSAEEVVSLDGSFATTTIMNLSGDMEITSIGDVSRNIRKLKTELSNDTETSFHYGVQVGDGGLIMQNSALVTGNVYVNGPIIASNSNEIKGDVVSARSTGSITGIYATGTAYAHNIANSKIDGDAYYQIIDGITKVGPNKVICPNFYCHPDSPDQPPSDLPISDELISSWEDAADVSVITSPCPYEIKSDTVLGPVKIECNLEISQNPTITLMGPVWVAGSIDVSNTAIIRIDPSLGKKSVPFIADDPLNRLTSSKITLQNRVTFEGSGTEGSYILVLSQNNSAENGGSEKAIFIKNTVSGDLLLYAGHGQIYLGNRSDLREVAGYKITLSNQANVIYESGLANLLFESGPGGGYSIDSWREVK